MAIFKRKIRTVTPDGKVAYHFSDNWTVDVYVNGRRIKREVGADKTKAKNIERKLKVDEAEGKYLDVLNDRRISFDEVVTDFLEYSKNNKRSYLRDTILVKRLNSQFSGKKLFEITPILIESYKGKRLSEGMAPATVNRELAFAKAAINWAIKNEKASQNPFCKVKMMKENNEILRYLSEDEMKRLIEVCPPYLKEVVVTALNTAMRRGELLNLKWEDVNLKQGIILLKHTKSGKWREIPINGVLRTLLENLRVELGVNYNPESNVFLNVLGEPYRRPDNSFHKALKAAGIKDFRFHDLRHSAASWMTMAGIDLATIKEILGHSSLRMTMRYAHLSPVHKRESMEILGSKLKPHLNAQPIQNESDMGTKWEQLKNLESEEKQIYHKSI